MRVIWICGLPHKLQEDCCSGKNYGASAAWSWIMGHFPIPASVELHLVIPITKGPWRNTQVEYRGAQVHLVRCLPGRAQTFFLFDYFSLKPVIRKINPDVVHGWGTEVSFSRIAQRLAKAKAVVQVQGLINEYIPYLPNNLLTRYVAWQERRTLQQAKTVFVESEYSAQITRPFIGENTRLIHVDHPLRSTFLSESPSVGTEQKILFLGSICKRKGIFDALDAFEKLAGDAWSLCVIGAGEQNVEFEQRLAMSPKRELITWIKQADESRIIQEMSGSSIFLLPSRMDTGPTALKEALAMGLWPVCYDNSGPKEYVTRFDYGVLAATGDVKDLALVLQQAVNNKAWMQEDRLTICVQRVRKELSANTIWNHLVGYYQEILDA